MTNPKPDAYRHADGYIHIKAYLHGEIACTLEALGCTPVWFTDTKPDSEIENTLRLIREWAESDPNGYVRSETILKILNSQDRPEEG